MLWTAALSAGLDTLGREWHPRLLTRQIAQPIGGGEYPCKEHSEKESVGQSVRRTFTESEELKDESEGDHR